MSIEIIEKPTHKCSVCGCVFTFDKEDFQEDKEYVGYQTFRDVYNINTLVHCPICGSPFIIKTEQKMK